jgi:hypothetical protein
MAPNVLGRVLTIEEVKQKMKDVRDAAVHYGGVVHCGERGRDELVIVSLETWRKHTSRDDAAPGTAADGPYAALQRALDAGRVGLSASGPPPRRRLANIRDETGLTVEEMIAAASEPPTPRRRRAG